VILDSNILIYSIAPDGSKLDPFVRDPAAAVSVLTFVEVLGFHRLNPNDRTALEDLLAEIPLYAVTPPILDMAVRLRRQRRMGLADAVIAATALVHDRPLVTRNSADFDWIPGLKLVDPFETAGSS
jgi:predicted nucleic acid-binding protein